MVCSTCLKAAVFSLFLACEVFSAWTIQVVDEGKSSTDDLPYRPLQSGLAEPELPQEVQPLLGLLYVYVRDIPGD